MADGARPRTPVRAPSRLRALLRTLHLWLGLGAGLLFALLGITGTVLTYQPELLRWQYPALFAQPVPDDAAIARGLQRLLADPPAGVTGGDLPRAATPYWQLYTSDGRRVYMDAAAENELLVRSSDNDWVLWMRELHTHLLAGHWGEEAVGVVGLVSLFLLGSGVYLWWPRFGGWWANLRWFAAPPVRRWLSWHRSVGVFTLPLLFLVTLTGAGMVYHGAARAVLGTLLSDAPDPTAPAAIERAIVEQADRAPTRAAATGHAVESADDHAAARVLAAARAALPRARLARVSLPAPDDARLGFRARSPGEWHPYGRSLVWIDRDRAHALASSDATALAPAARATHAIYPLHMGAVGGWPYRTAVALSGLLPAFLLGTGTLLWLRRRRPR